MKRRRNVCCFSKEYCAYDQSTISARHFRQLGASSSSTETLCVANCRFLWKISKLLDLVGGESWCVCVAN